jgi:PAT family beta-lactamase induction signal transducer AmpG
MGSTLLKALQQKRMIAVLFLGFSSGLPIMLLYKCLKIWLRREGIDLSTIGYMSWVTLPYSLKFIWAAFFDRFTPFTIGRRRSWLLITQFGLVLGLIALGLSNPTISIPLVVMAAMVVCFFSASQDIVVDAYRREILPDNELGIGAAIGVYGYRIAMLVASGFGLWLVDKDTLDLSFHQMFFLMAAIMGVGIATTLSCQEPPVHGASPKNLKQAIVDPFLEFFKREGAVVILLFILFFKIGDAMVGGMLSPFYVDVGFTNAQIAAVTSGLGFFSTMSGLFVGGALLFRFGYNLPLFFFGILQAVSTFSFILLTQTGVNLYALSGVVFFEDFSSGMGTAALVAFISTMTNKQFTATQYALFSSLASFGQTFFSGFSGRIITAIGYGNFFIFGAVVAIPGLLLLFKMWQIQKKAVALSKSG